MHDAILGTCLLELILSQRARLELQVLHGGKVILGRCSIWVVKTRGVVEVHSIGRRGISVPDIWKPAHRNITP